MFEIIATEFFERNIKKLSKKYPFIKRDCSDLFDQLEKGEFVGDVLQGFSSSVYKVRVGSSDQKKGKRAGFRVVYYVITQDQKILLLTIYAKTSQENISDDEIRKILNDI